MDKKQEKKLRQQMECIWGTCSHKLGAKTCLYYKVVDLPVEKQVDYIMKTIKQTCYTKNTKVKGFKN